MDGQAAERTTRPNSGRLIHRSGSYALERLSSLQHKNSRLLQSTTFSASGSRPANVDAYGDDVANSANSRRSLPMAEKAMLWRISARDLLVINGFPQADKVALRTAAARCRHKNLCA
jgi:hypothetical protein